MTITIICSPRQTVCSEQKSWAVSNKSFPSGIAEGFMHQNSRELKEVKNLQGEIAAVTAVKDYRGYRKKQGYCSGGDTRHSIF